ncbi:hypothetical protein ACTP13_12795 [Paenibacillus peoriae]|uniref:hypothetical protein n=1 Tax=Paenibacillus peoriae TaxID=59893 RepID=UPI003F97A135
MGCEKDDLEKILQHALYIIAKYDQPEIAGDYPQIIPYQYEDDNWIWNEEEPDDFQTKLDRIKYHEPLAFYNKARKTEDPLYYYKVVEYFFIINKQSEIFQLIQKYNKDDNMDFLIESLTKIYTKKENILLENLLSNIHGIQEIVRYAFTRNLTVVEDVSDFSKSLYAYRNSIVHRKKDTKLELTVPQILKENNGGEWIHILRNLAEKVIQQFC